MSEEIFDPDCGACERAQQDYAELERVTDDLAALVRQLVRTLRKAAPDNDLADKALDYLRRKGLQGTPLRQTLEGGCETSVEAAFWRAEANSSVEEARFPSRAKQKGGSA